MCGEVFNKTANSGTNLITIFENILSRLRDFHSVTFIDILLIPYIRNKIIIISNNKV